MAKTEKLQAADFSNTLSMSCGDNEQCPKTIEENNKCKISLRMHQMVENPQRSLWVSPKVNSTVEKHS